MMKSPKSKRPEKKSEMLDVRLPYGMKRALVAACRKQGVTVSDTVRGLISEYISAAEAAETQPRLKGIAMKIVHHPRKTLGIIGTSLAACFAITSMPSMADSSTFEHLDLDNDGFLSREEAGFLDVMGMDDAAFLDGFTLPDGFESIELVPAEPMEFASYDADGDGQLSEKEFEAVRGVSFEFDGVEGEPQLLNFGDGSQQILFLGPLDSERPIEGAELEALLQSGGVEWAPREPGAVVFSTTPIPSLDGLVTKLEDPSSED